MKCLLTAFLRSIVSFDFVAFVFAIYMHVNTASG